MIMPLRDITGLTTQNLFEAFAEQKALAPVKARRRTAKRAETLERKKADDDVCLREWRQWRASEVREALAGPHGAKLAALIADLKRAHRWNDIDDAGIAAAWTTADPDTRALVSRVVTAFVVRLRLRAGLAPFDDTLPF